jgi:hypothetical protein
MVFVLYKHNENELIFTGVYENQNDAIEIKNLHNDNSFKIVNLLFWKNKINKDKIVYNEEDNNINESDIELTPQFRKRRRIYHKELMNDNNDVKDLKPYENYKREYNIYTYMVLACIIVLFFLLNILLVGFHYILYRHMP